MKSTPPPHIQPKFLPRVDLENTQQSNQNLPQIELEFYPLSNHSLPQPNQIFQPLFLVRSDPVVRHVRTTPLPRGNGPANVSDVIELD